MHAIGPATSKVSRRRLLSLSKLQPSGLWKPLRGRLRMRTQRTAACNPDATRSQSWNGLTCFDPSMRTCGGHMR
eukprot:scaffold58022_cov75-Phaeocystis_antarctica.AAC.2